jgi:hypothetical protein
MSYSIRRIPHVSKLNAARCERACVSMLDGIKGPSGATTLCKNSVLCGLNAEIAQHSLSLTREILARNGSLI